MYVVRRPFKSFGKAYTAGSLVEPAAVKHFRGKIAEGKIIEVTEQTYDVAKSYFKQKFGVDLPPISRPAEDADQEVKDPEPVKPTVVVAKANVTVR